MGERQPGEGRAAATADAARAEAAHAGGGRQADRYGVRRRQDQEWGTLVWVVMTTGMRRGEVAALTWSNVDLDEGMVEVRHNFVKRNRIEKIKATKTHQMRRIALDTETTVLLAKQKDRVQARCALLGIEFDEEKVYDFTGVRNADPRKPASPDGISARYKTTARRPA
jgi:integrase